MLFFLADGHRILAKFFKKTVFLSLFLSYDLIVLLKSRPSEIYLPNFCTSALLKAIKIKLLYSKKADGPIFRSAKVR
jgi:hypothetical protein